MKIEEIRLLEAVIYGYQQGEDAARAQALKVETGLRMELVDTQVKLAEIKAERDQLARMNDELTTNEWDRIKSVLNAVAHGALGFEFNGLPWWAHVGRRVIRVAGLC